MRNRGMMEPMQDDAIQLRLATPGDSEALRAVYAPYVEGTAVSFEYEVPGADEFRRRVEEVLAFYPYLVAERAGEVVGFAYAHRHAERAAFDWNAELSVYLRADACGRGLGRRLYTTLMTLVQEQGVRNVYGLVRSPNPASERLHESLGFSLAGTWHRTGYKLGAWHDLLLYEKALPAAQEAPAAPVTPFRDLPQDWVEVVFAAVNKET